MKNIKTLLVAAALLLAASGVQASEDSPGARPTSVAEMLQKKQDRQLRDQLAKEGRWDEIRKMDEEQILRQQAHQQQIYEKLNEQLAPISSGDGQAGDGVGSLCDPVRTLGTLRLKTHSATSHPTF